VPSSGTPFQESAVSSDLHPSRPIARSLESQPRHRLSTTARRRLVVAASVAVLIAMVVVASSLLGAHAQPCGGDVPRSSDAAGGHVIGLIACARSDEDPGVAPRGLRDPGRPASAASDRGWYGVVWR
jgi:hypothetical protein